MRLRDLQEQLGDDLEVRWKSFLLRPSPSERPRSLERFKAYTQSWQRPQAEEPRAGFRVWQSDEGPPSHSVPPHQAYKAALRIDSEAADHLHEGLLDAYFRRNRDITRDDVLVGLWADAGLPADRFAERQDPQLIEEIRADFTEAMENGASGAPAVRLEGMFGCVMGAQPTEVYARWLEKVRAMA